MLTFTGGSEHSSNEVTAKMVAKNSEMHSFCISFVENNGHLIYDSFHALLSLIDVATYGVLKALGPRLGPGTSVAFLISRNHKLRIEKKFRRYHGERFKILNIII